MLLVNDRERAVRRRSEDARLLMDGEHRVITLTLSEVTRTRPDIQHIGRVWTLDEARWNIIINSRLGDFEASTVPCFLNLFHNGYHFELYGIYDFISKGN